MRQALVLNYTGLDYHYGCFCTCEALKWLLQDDGYTIRTVSVDAIADIRPIPDTVNDLNNLSFRTEYIEKNVDLINLIGQSDIVVINGEGTLHGFSHRPRNLLYLIYISKTLSGRPTYLVNHSLFPADFPNESNPIAVEFYKSCVQLLDGAAVRDSRSRAVYEEMGVTCVQAFDLLPVYLRRTGIRRQPDEISTDKVVLGVGIRMQGDHVAALGRAVRLAVPEAFSVAMLNGAPTREPPQEEAYAPLLIEEDARIKPVFSADRNREPVSAEAAMWLGAIAQASLLVTGRYHHVVAALALGTPIIGITSNTDKIECGFATAGVTGNVIDPAESDFSDRIMGAVSQAIAGAGGVACTTESQRSEIYRLALANRIWPEADKL